VNPKTITFHSDVQTHMLNRQENSNVQKHTYVRLRSTSNPQIHVRLLRHRYLYLRSMSFIQILKSMSFFQILKSVFQFSNLWPFLTSQMTSLMYALTQTLTNKSAIYLRIWNGRRFENTIKSVRDLRYWRQWCRFKSGRWSESITYNRQVNSNM
jgi:hypothetical protein